MTLQLITEYIPNELDLSAALKPINLEKNRAGGIIPVNLKRVLLPARPGVEGSDYINATYLQVWFKNTFCGKTYHLVNILLKLTTFDILFLLCASLNFKMISLITKLCFISCNVFFFKNSIKNNFELKNKQKYSIWLCQCI